MKEFSILNLNAPVFKALLSYSLFQEFKKDKELFIEIRKDNYINVYYQGGCVAKIEYKNDIWTTSNAKYLGDKTSEYIPSEEYLTSNLSDVKKNIEKEYSQYKYLKTLNKEDLSEKYYQADLVLRKYAKTHLDGEFLLQTTNKSTY